MAHWFSIWRSADPLPSANGSLDTSTLTVGIGEQGAYSSGCGQSATGRYPLTVRLETQHIPILLRLLFIG
jgi:hypothetical protein